MACAVLSCMSERIIAATDGSCDPNPGPCAWAYVVADAAGKPSRTVSGALGHGTNQVAELAAVLALLEDTTGPVTIQADSVYAIRCLTTWLPNWQRNGWLNSAKKPVANRHLIERAAAVMRDRDVRFTWVRGHSGHPLNEAADRAAKAALTAPVHRTFAAPAGTAPPDVLTVLAPEADAEPVSTAPEPVPRSGDWPPERGRCGPCPDCGALVQQYPVDRRWVLLDTRPAPTHAVHPAHHWYVDDDGRAHKSPSPPHSTVRTHHTDLCPSTPHTPDWAGLLREGGT